MSTTDLVFQSRPGYGSYSQPNMWQVGAAVITAGYILFALVLVGVPQFARGGVVFTMLGFGWLGMGVLLKAMVFPRILLLPSLFFLMIVLSGVFMPVYPVEYVGTMTTIWLGSIVLAAFVANGVSLNFVIAGFAVVFFANLAAIAVGYDGYLINEGGATTESLEYETIERKSGLAGQANLMVALCFTFPFLFFLTRKSLGVLAYAVGIGTCLSMVFLSGSRSTVAFSAVFIVLGALFLIRSFVLRLVLIAVAVAALMILSSVMSNADFWSRIEHSTLGEIHVVKRILAGVDQVERSQDLRVEMATQFWPKYFEKPGFGHGPNQFGVVTGSETYAHNNFAEIAVNWGTFGLLLYYSLYVIALFGIIKYLPVDYRMIAPLIFLAAADFVFVTFTERPMVLCLCLMLVTLYHNRPESRRRRRRRSRSSSGDDSLWPRKDPDAVVDNTRLDEHNSFDDEDFKSIGLIKKKSDNSAVADFRLGEQPSAFDIKL